jgi:protein-tyrosine phosphatase
MVTITNFRDIGGIKNTEGKIVAREVFLRSGELSQLDKKDEQRLKENYRLGKIVDLRSDAEVSERPDKSVIGTEYIHIDILKDIHDEGASISDFVKIGSPEKSADYMEKLYADIALDQAAQAGYTNFFDQILSLKERESLLFHCFAGKDRTGIAAALVLETLDVPKEAIYADYMLTNKLRKTENALLLAQAKETNLPPANLKALEVALNVESRYLDNFYWAVKKNYGDCKTYLKEAIGIDKEKTEFIKHRFLLD